MNKKQKTILLSFMGLILCIAGFFVYNNRSYTIRATKDSVVERSNLDFETFHGKNYNTDLKTIVLLGIDNNDEMKERETGYAGQSDAIFVYVIDTKTEKGKILQISRDTMIDLDLYDIGGEYVTTQSGQLALQYAYGDGKEQSCIHTSEKISEMLHGIPIQAYIAFDMAGIADVSEVFGGIDLILDDDYTNLNPAYVSGTTVHLEGKSLEDFIRYRNLNQTGSNTKRMEHHRQVLQACMEKIPKFNEDVFNRASSYMVSNLKMNEIQHLTKSKMADDIIQIPGTMVSGEKHDEFYMDENELEKIILELFYQ